MSHDDDREERALDMGPEADGLDWARAEIDRRDRRIYDLGCRLIESERKREAAEEAAQELQRMVYDNIGVDPSLEEQLVEELNSSLAIVRVARQLDIDPAKALRLARAIRVAA